ncbi:hypothetical protein CLV51_102568 [Chitinophaga niastensis]|uniref:Uncharacterized protein n=1 Tax=Chitinophaga niastensis TaxID=536980 RepID=A0A2P8HNB9_CHINA|nr:hypothetical protein [Chitinophaga niastensis]PSL47711.1 hypothetical protein CLV51_102568 [Chitinophaga niastensis]
MAKVYVIVIRQVSLVILFLLGLISLFVDGVFIYGIATGQFKEGFQYSDLSFAISYVLIGVFLALFTFLTFYGAYKLLKGTKKKEKKSIELLGEEF